jgi:hypothetical protein
MVLVAGLLEPGERDPAWKMLGRASAAMTLDVNTDLFEDDLDAVAARLDRAVAPASVVRSSAQTTVESA